MPSISDANAAAAGPEYAGGASASGTPRPSWFWGHTLAWGCAAFVAGALAQLQQEALWPQGRYVTWLLAAACLVVGGWWGGRWSALHKRRMVRCVPGVVLLAGVALASFAAVGLRAVAHADHALAPQLEGRDIRVTARVVAMPHYTDAGVRLRLTVVSAQGAEGPVVLPPRIDVAWYGGVTGDGVAGLELQRRPGPIRAGDLWALTVRLKAPHGLANPHGWDYELWLWEQEVQATGYVRAGPRDEPPQHLGSTWNHPVERLRQQVRDAIVHQLGAATGTAQDRAAGVVAALVTGDQRAIERADWDVFRATGVSHLMSISGLHITLFAWLTSWAVRRLWGRSAWLCHRLPGPTAAALAGLLLAAGYALFSGWGVPAQRTVIMLAVVVVLRCSGSRWPWPVVWLVALSAVVLADPWALMQAGFWLSFVAVAVLFATNLGASRADGERVSGGFSADFGPSEGLVGLPGRWRWLHPLGRMLREQWTLTLALSPLTLLLFGQVSLVGLVANLVAIPWVTLVVTPLSLVGVLLPPLWSLAAVSLQPLMAGLQWMADWPGAVWYAPAAPWWAGWAGVLGAAVLVLRWPWPVRLLAVPLLLPVMAWQAPRPPHGQLEVLAMDIGQGNAVLVRTAEHALLYDAGPRYSLESDAGHRVVVPLLRALGERLDLLVLSHRDADHTGGAGAVLAQQPRADVLGSLDADHPLRAVRPVRPCLAGQHWEWDGVRFEVLHPAPQDVVPSARPNTISCVLRIAPALPTPAPAVVLAGDIEQAQEQALLARGAPLRADLLLVPHHGSQTSSSAAFLQAVAPRTALVQAGYRNRFGHPAPQVLERYAQHGVRVVASAHCGAAAWTSQQPAELRCQRAVQARYWHHRTPPG